MEVVQVRLPDSPRSRPCDPAGHALEVGDPCVVESERGPVLGLVTMPPFRNPHYGSPPLPRVIRRATREDEEVWARKAEGESEARRYCLDRIEERRLGMKLGAVERTLDGRKLTFLFTAEGRVDFRDLVRDLSGHFHTRVEMRQLGDREDAGMKGGMGPCGRALCCSTFLKGFEPISIKMAKAQGLSLNPSKISGMCGRLMCCLKYEYDPLTGQPKKAAGCNGCGSTPKGGAAPGVDGALPVVS